MGKGTSGSNTAWVPLQHGGVRSAGPVSAAPAGGGHGHRLCPAGSGDRDTDSAPMGPGLTAPLSPTAEGTDMFSFFCIIS